MYIQILEGWLSAIGFTTQVKPVSLEKIMDLNETHVLVTMFLKSRMEWRYLRKGRPPP